MSWVLARGLHGRVGGEAGIQRSTNSERLAGRFQFLQKDECCLLNLRTEELMANEPNEGAKFKPRGSWTRLQQ